MKPAISSADTGTYLAETSPASSRFTNSEPAATAIEKVSRNRVTTGAAPPSVPVTSAGNCETRIAPIAKNQLMPRMHSHTPSPSCAVLRMRQVLRNGLRSTCTSPRTGGAGGISRLAPRPHAASTVAITPASHGGSTPASN